MIEIEFIGGNCPVQAEGKIDGTPFYFRGRGNGWRIGIGGGPVGKPDWSTFGECESAGWMLEGEARELIEKAAALWRSMGRPMDGQSCPCGQLADPFVGAPQLGANGHGFAAEFFAAQSDEPSVAHFDPTGAPKGTDWHERWLRVAEDRAKWSKDPTTQVGCVIVGPDHVDLSYGFNGFPKGVEDTDERLHDRPLKRRLIVHAEANAVAFSARTGRSLLGAIAYVSRPCCAACAGLLIQAGIDEVHYRDVPMDPAWWESLNDARMMFAEAGVTVVEHRENGQ